MKYIIDVPEEPFSVIVLSTIKGIPIATNAEFEPYTEPDRQAVEDEVWELAKAVDEIIDYEWWCDSYREAKAKYEAWQKEEDQICVGDEVLYRHEKYFVGYVDDYRCHLIDINWMRMVAAKEEITKTGIHFDEVEELLKKMKED